MSDFFLYYRSVFAEAWKDTFAFIKRRVVNLLIAVLIAIFSWHFGATQPFNIALVCILKTIGGAYALVFCLSFVVNYFRAPVSINKKREAQIGELGEKVRAHERKQDLDARFAGLMQQGERLAEQLRQGLPPFKNWLGERQAWMERVNEMLTGAGFLADAAVFRHAGEPQNHDVQPGTVADGPYYRKLYGGELERARGALRDLVQRRLA